MKKMDLEPKVIVAKDGKEMHRMTVYLPAQMVAEIRNLCSRNGVSEYEYLAENIKSMQVIYGLCRAVVEARK